MASKNIDKISIRSDKFQNLNADGGQGAGRGAGGTSRDVTKAPNSYIQGTVKTKGNGKKKRAY